MEGYYQTGPGQIYKGQTIEEIYAEAAAVRKVKKVKKIIKEKMSESRKAVLRKMGLASWIK
jgi:hypothetical protein